MKDLTAQVRQVAGSLLRSGQVDLVIGYEWGALPLRARPCYVHSPDDVDRLIWNPCCQNNLSPYLLVGTAKVAVFVKGCDARAIVVTIAEHQVPRENVTIVALPCQGVIDWRKVEALLDGRELLRATLDGPQVTLVAKGVQRTLAVNELLCDVCHTCTYPTAPVYDLLIGDAVSGEVGGLRSDASFADVQGLEAMTAEERRAYFEHEFGRCIRCYACRQACPLCYCQECFIDQTRPAWLGKTDDPSDTLLFHTVRALHLAGRCVGCGACARACPMSIDLMAMNRKLIRDVKDWYGFESGLDPEAVPLLSTFRLDDPEECIK